MAVLRGDGMGGLATPAFFATGPSPRASEAGDLDGDGLPDLAIALESVNAVGLLRSDERDALALVGADPLPTLNRPSSLVVGDLDGNGVDDILVGSIEVGGGIAVLLADP